MKNNILLAVIVIIALGLGGIYFYSSNNEAAQEVSVIPDTSIKNGVKEKVAVISDVPDTVVEKHEAPVPKKTATTFLYTDKRRGYQIELPISWEGLLKVVEKKEGFQYGYQYFYVLENPIVYEDTVDMFNIQIYTLNEWKTMREECGQRGESTWSVGCLTEDEILGKSETTIFSYGPRGGGIPMETPESLRGSINYEYIKNHFTVISNKDYKDPYFVN